MRMTNKRRLELIGKASDVFCELRVAMNLIRRGKRPDTKTDALIRAMKDFNAEPVKPTAKALRYFKQELKRRGLAEMSRVLVQSLPTTRMKNAVGDAITDIGGRGHNLRILVGMSHCELMMQKGIGKGTLVPVSNRLAQWGLRIGMTPDEIAEVFGP